jgi:hypothetical protein
MLAKHCFAWLRTPAAPAAGRAGEAGIHGASRFGLPASAPARVRIDGFTQVGVGTRRASCDPARSAATKTNASVVPCARLASAGPGQ